MSSENKLPIFLIVVYRFQSTASDQFSRAPHIQKHILFADIIQSASAEEACKEGAANFWEQALSDCRNADIRHDQSGSSKKSLPDNFYADASMLHNEDIRRVWKTVFIQMRGFHMMDTLFSKPRSTKSGKLQQSK